jgi:nucleotide-binding universal stress UspA family protein
MRSTTAKSLISLRNILFATDFSPTSEAALAHAAAWAQKHGATLHVAHVLLPPEPMVPFQGVATPLPPGHLEKEIRRQAESRLQEMESSPPLQGLEVRPVLSSGKPAEVLQELAGRRKADLLVLGTHGRTGVRRLLVGSVVERVLRSAQCPVLTIGPEAAVKASQPVKEIVCAVDLLPGSERTAAYACELAAGCGAQLTLFTVDEGDAQRFEYEATMAEVKGEMRMTEFLKDLKPACAAHPRVAVGFGVPAEAILNYIREHKTDLLVMGVRRREQLGAVEERILGGTSHHVLAHAPVPVLSIPG